MNDLTAQLEAAILEPDLIISLERNIWGGQPFIRLSKPGATPRSKPVQVLTHVIVGDEQTQPHSALLAMLAEMLKQAGR